MKFKPVLFFAFAALVVMLLLVWFSPVPFSACINGVWCTAAYWLTESAGKYGTVILIVLISIFFSLRFNQVKRKLINFFLSAVSLLLFIGAFAWINEHLTKKAIRIPRPSHSFIFANSSPQIKLDSLYFLDEEYRHRELKKLIDTSPEFFKTFDERVINHWIEEAGYSFPSGHSFNAFLLGTIMSFGMINSRRKIARSLWFLPLLWSASVAISRVAIGAHSALDVSFGAAMGILVSSAFLYFENARKLIIHKQTAETV